MGVFGQQSNISHANIFFPSNCHSPIYKSPGTQMTKLLYSFFSDRKRFRLKFTIMTTQKSLKIFPLPVAMILVIRATRHRLMYLIIPAPLHKQSQRRRQRARSQCPPQITANTHLPRPSLPAPLSPRELAALDPNFAFRAAKPSSPISAPTRNSLRTNAVP